MSDSLHYTPLALNEMDALHRMVDGQDLYVEVVGWGYHSDPQIIAGDKRVQIRFPMELSKPDILQAVYHFDLCLKLRDGTILRSEKMGVPGGVMYVQAGMIFDMIWDISIDSIDSNLVRHVRPGIQGKKLL